MARILILVTKAKSLELLDGRRHPSGFWAEEFVVPYEQFIKGGYEVDIATVDGEPSVPDPDSLEPRIIGYTRPAGSPDHDEEQAAHFREVIASVDDLRHPLDVSNLREEQVAQYAGAYICGGHGAMRDLPHDVGMTRVVRWLLEGDKPLAAVCHGQSALLPVRDAHSRWPLAGYRMTAFSHEEELVTEMAGSLPFVLEVELERLGAKYEKAPVIWDACVVEDRNLITGQNPYSSAPLAAAFLRHLQS
jgi:putative intracellular protease/amidase